MVWCKASSQLVLRRRRAHDLGQRNTIAYNAFGKPTDIDSTGKSSSFIYGINRELLKQTHEIDGVTIEQWSFGAYEIVATQGGPNAGTRERYQLAGGLILSFEDTDYADPIESYTFADVLGSITAVTDAFGDVTERHRYDPWGRPREVMNWLAMSDGNWYDTQRYTQATSKGFTGHEMLDHVGIIHMGGRIFDPAIGRFLSADPVVKGMGSTEAYNRYSYVGNNPMSYTDPTGYFSLGLGIGGRVKREFSRVESRYRNEIRAFVTGGLEPIARYGGRELARFVQRNKYGGQILGLVTIAGCSVASAGTATAGCVAAVQGISTGSMAYGTGESVEHALRAGTRAAAIAMADSMASGFIGGVTEGMHPLRAATIGAGLHGMRGATFAAINGYDIRSGLIGGATEGALGGAIADFTPDSRTGQTAMAAMIGGTVSEVSGGNFATGAVTGAMGYLFNQLGEWRGRARAASAASLVLDADGGIAMLMDGRRTYDEALQLRNFVMDAPLMDFLGIFPELSNRGLTDIRLIIESMRIDIQAVGIQGLNRMIVGGGGLANDIAIGMSVSAAASVIGVSYQTVALIELSLAAGTSMHQRDHRAPLVDKIREKYIR